MPLAQSSELPPPRPIERVDPERRRKRSSGFDHRRVGILTEIVERNRGNPGSVEGAHRRGDVPGLDEAGIGHEQRPAKPQFPRQVADPGESARPENHARAGLKIERSHHRRGRGSGLGVRVSKSF